MIITTSNPPRCATCGADADLAADRVGDGIYGKQRPFCRPCYTALPVDEYGSTGWVEANLYNKEQPVSTSDTTTLSDRLAPLAAEYAALSEQADRIKERQDFLKEQIRSLVDGPDTYQAGDLTVVVSPNRRFVEAKALAAIPEDIKPLVTYPETRVDRDRLKVLAPEAYEAGWTDYEHKVGIK